MTYKITREARRDMLRIWSYIADNNEDAANHLLDLLKEHFHLLGRNPYAGRRRDEFRPGYRSFSVGQYLILYRVRENHVEIMHVLHGKRDLDAMFE